MKPACAALIAFVGFAALTACSTQVDLDWRTPSPGNDDDDDDDGVGNMSGLVIGKRFPSGTVQLEAYAVFGSSALPILVATTGCQSTTLGEFVGQYEGKTDVGGVSLVDGSFTLPLATPAEPGFYVGTADGGPLESAIEMGLSLTGSGVVGAQSFDPGALFLPGAALQFTMSSPLFLVENAEVSWSSSGSDLEGVVGVYLFFEDSVDPNARRMCVFPPAEVSYRLGVDDVAPFSGDGVLYGSWIHERETEWPSEGRVRAYGLAHSTFPFAAPINTSTSRSSSPTPTPTPSPPG